MNTILGSDLSKKQFKAVHSTPPFDRPLLERNSYVVVKGIDSGVGLLA